ncbi:TetR family transcriptional regulator, partial [Halorubrum ezzemoulense]
MNDPFAEPSDTRQAILGAAFRALCEHGYANVTIQRIGDEFDKSPSLVYHHYDGKDDLLIDLLGFLLDEFEA